MADKSIPDARDALQTLSDKLGALTALQEDAHGGGMEAFKGMNEVLRDEYLGHCANLSHECKRLAESLYPVMSSTLEASYG